MGLLWCWAGQHIPPKKKANQILRRKDVSNCRHCYSPCLISETHHLGKPFSSSTAVKPRATGQLPQGPSPVPHHARSRHHKRSARPKIWAIWLSKKTTDWWAHWFMEITTITVMTMMIWYDSIWDWFYVNLTPEDMIWFDWNKLGPFLASFMVSSYGLCRTLHTS